MPTGQLAPWRGSRTTRTSDTSTNNNDDDDDDDDDDDNDNKRPLHRTNEHNAC
jgi:hypothetical protein